MDNHVDTSVEPCNGSDIKLYDRYVLWCHDVHSKDWSISGYKKMCMIDNVSDFWRLMNNFDKLNYKGNNFFFMKEDTQPIWEHENNRHGGVCSFKVSIDETLRIWKELAVYLVCNALTNNFDDINGISFSPKNNWAIIKIWNRDCKNVVSETLAPDLLERYRDLSIKYKSNEPEY